MGIFRRKAEDRSLARTDTYPSFGPVLQVGDIGPAAALRIADVYAAIRAIAETAASIPLIPYRRLADGERERYSGRITDLLRAPAPGVTQASLISTTAAHLNMFGNAYWGKYRDPEGVVQQVAVLDPTTVTVSVHGGEPRYTRMNRAGVQEHGREDILHFRALSTDGVVGLSPIAQCRQALGLASSLAGHADSFVKNAGRPSGVLRVPGWRTAQAGAAEAVRSDWESPETGFAGPDRSGRLLIITGEDDVQYQQLSLSMEDAQFVAQRELSTREIARVFRIPSWVIDGSSGDSMTYANVSQQAEAFLRFGLAPWLCQIEQTITNDVDLAPSTVYVEFLVDAMLRPDPATRAAVYTAALAERGWMNRDEVRHRENLPKEEGST